MSSKKIIINRFGDISPRKFIRKQQFLRRMSSKLKDKKIRSYKRIKYDNAKSYKKVLVNNFRTTLS